MDVKKLRKKIQDLSDNYMKVPVALLKKAEWNYKEENEAMQAKLVANIQRVGQIENLHVRELDDGYMEVINGNHRLDALREIGKEFAIVYNHGKISLEEGQRIAIETNETKFSADYITLSELMNELRDEFDFDELKSTMPFDDSEWERMDAIFEHDFDAYEEDPEPDQDPTKRLVRFDMPTEVYERWLEWKRKCNEILGYESDWKAFEFAIEEALQLPDEQLNAP